MPAPAFPDPAAAVRWLESHINYERRLASLDYDARTFALDAFARRLAALGDPHRGIPAIHIAGTRGKGSASQILDALARAAGLRTALFTSPHVRDWRERVRLDGIPIPEPLFRELLSEIAALPSDPSPDDAQGHYFRTLFETLTALFFLAARRHGADLAIVETGLGGRLDATNVLDPGPVLLTRIGLEHTRLLGSTLAAIAAEKAAILKPGGWAVAGAQLGPDPVAVFRRRATETEAPLEFASDRVPLLDLRAHPAGLDLLFRFEGAALSLATPLLGPFQAENVQNALAMLAGLRARGRLTNLSRDAIAATLATLTLPGRMEPLLPGPPRVIVDGAHCPTGAGAVAGAMQAHFPQSCAVAIVGMMEDKDHDGFFRALARWGGWRAIVCYTPAGPRALPAGHLAAAARPHFPALPIEVSPDLHVALERTISLAEKTDSIVALGTIIGIVPISDWFLRDVSRAGDLKYAGNQAQVSPQAQPRPDLRDPRAQRDAL